MATAEVLVPEHFIVHDTPSRHDGISFEQELTYRQNCCQLILDIAEGFRQTPSEPSVQLPCWVVCTAAYYMHQYYCIESMHSSDRFVMSIAALFLACKVDECPRSLELFVKTAWACRVRNCAAVSDEAREVAYHRWSEASFKEALTEGILAGERALFYAFNFGLRRFEAHHLLVAHASAAAALGRAPPGQWCVRVAWELLEHGMFSLMYLCYTQQEIAWAHLIFAARVLQCTPALFQADGTPLWAADGVSLDRARIERLIGEIASAFEQPTRAPASHGASSPTKPPSQAQQQSAGALLEPAAPLAASTPRDLGGAGMLDALAALATPAAALQGHTDAPPPSA